MFAKRRSAKKRKRRGISRKREAIKAAILIILIAAALRFFLVFPLRVPDEAMQSSFLAGDFILASKIAYKFDAPGQGDIVIFDHPYKPNLRMVRRVIATEGQSVEVVGKTVYIDGEPFREPGTVQHSDYRILPPDFSSRDYCPSQLIPPGQLFVLGDNRDESEDSRDFGPITLDSVYGKSLFVYFSWAPDPNAPEMESPYIIPAIQILFYNLFHFPSRVRWDRFLAGS